MTNVELSFEDVQRIGSLIERYTTTMDTYLKLDILRSDRLIIDVFHGLAHGATFKWRVTDRRRSLEYPHDACFAEGAATSANLAVTVAVGHAAKYFNCAVEDIIKEMEEYTALRRLAGL